MAFQSSEPRKIKQGSESELCIPHCSPFFFFFSLYHWVPFTEHSELCFLSFSHVVLWENSFKPRHLVLCSATEPKGTFEHFVPRSHSTDELLWERSAGAQSNFLQGFGLQAFRVYTWMQKKNEKNEILFYCCVGSTLGSTCTQGWMIKMQKQMFEVSRGHCKCAALS